MEALSPPLRNKRRVDGKRKASFLTPAIPVKKAEAMPETPGIQKDEVCYDDITFGQKIGEGGFGDVFKGILWGQEVALKKLRVKGLKESHIRDFKQEVQIMRNLRHPNIVTFLGACLKLPHLCIVTEFVDNGNLEDLLEAGNLSLPLIIRFAIDIAKGLNWLHHKGIIHRDLKPANILIDRNYSIKLADFGLSHVKSRKGSDVGFYGVCGTSCYMAPEVISKKPYGIKCDVFSFGLLLCELIMGEYPYDQKKVPSKSAAFEKKIVEGLRPSIPEDCPAALAQLLTQCWQADPEQRPSMDRVLVLLKKFDTELKAKNDDILDQLPETAVKLIDQEKAKVQALQQEMCRGKARLRSLQADLKNTKSALAKEKRARRALEGELSQIQAGVSGEQAECIKLREELDLERLRFAKERKEFDVLRNRSDLHVAKYSQATQLHNTRASARAVGKKLANVPQKGKAQIVEDRENAHPNFVAPQPRLKRICSNLSGDQISNGNKKLEAPGAVSESTPISFRTRWRGARKDCEFGEEKKSDSEENSEEIEEATSSGNEENSEGENKEEDESEECEESDNNIAESESVEKNWTCLFSPIRTRAGRKLVMDDS